MQRWTRALCIVCRIIFKEILVLQAYYFLFFSSCDTLEAINNTTKQTFEHQALIMSNVTAKNKEFHIKFAFIEAPAVVDSIQTMIDANPEFFN